MKTLSNFLISVGFRSELVDEFTKTDLTSFRPFIGHHQGLLACVKNIFKRIFKIVFF